MTDRLRTVTATIANGASLSDAIPVGGELVVGLDLPTITSAAISFSVSVDDGTTYRDLYDSFGSEVSLPASTGARYVALDWTQFGSVTHVKVRSGTSAATVNQGAARSLKLVTRPA